ncbi:MAG: hypothetical protein BAJATHORv1_30409 [Candidatus Thorarchaeota archaeon]|nr:MAG: hypothetical protein BAJATHORv1_30409 [Candidatus Thorarchaeota archaeon]
MAEKPKLTKSEKLKEMHKEFKTGIGALAKAKLITKEEKAAKIAEYDQAFKDLIKEEKAKEKAKAKKAKK